MLSVIARTRPILSPSQPNTSPPAAAPSRNSAVIVPIHVCTKLSSTTPAAACISCSAGRATSGKIPISNPSNIHPRNAASNTIHGADFRPEDTEPEEMLTDGIGEAAIFKTIGTLAPQTTIPNLPSPVDP